MDDRKADWRQGYLGRFAIWLAIFAVIQATTFGYHVRDVGAEQAYAADSLWRQAGLVAGFVALAALFACVRGLLKRN